MHPLGRQSWSVWQVGTLVSEVFIYFFIFAASFRYYEMIHSLNSGTYGCDGNQTYEECNTSNSSFKLFLKM